MLLDMNLVVPGLFCRDTFDLNLVVLACFIETPRIRDAACMCPNRSLLASPMVLNNFHMANAKHRLSIIVLCSWWLLGVNPFNTLIGVGALDVLVWRFAHEKIDIFSPIPLREV